MRLKRVMYSLAWNSRSNSTNWNPLKAVRSRRVTSPLNTSCNGRYSAGVAVVVLQYDAENREKKLIRNFSAVSNIVLRYGILTKAQTLTVHNSIDEDLVFGGYQDVVRLFVGVLPRKLLVPRVVVDQLNHRHPSCCPRRTGQLNLTL